MKQIYLLLTAFFLGLFASAQEDMSIDVTYISGSGNNIEVEVAVQSRDKKELESLACKSVVYTYLFHGIEGVGTGLPILDQSDRERHIDYFRNIFMTRYSVYATYPKKQFGPKKNVAGVFDATYRVVFHPNALDTDLCRNDIIDCGKAPVTLPTIMVVPYRKQGETYRQIFDNNNLIRMAISKVEKELNNSGHKTLDFVTTFENALRHNEFTAENADSYAAQLIRNSGADIYITVDCQPSQGYSENQVALSLKAVNNATGDNLATATKTIREKWTLTNCCIAAVHRAMPDILRHIKTLPKQINSRLTIGIDGEASFNLYSSAGNSNKAILMLIREWMKNNTKEFHQKGMSKTEIMYDQVKLPDGVDTTDFSILLIQYLQSQGLTATPVIDGMTIYITLSESE